MVLSRWTKASIVIVLSSLFVYCFYWLRASLLFVYNYVSQNIDSVDRLLRTYVIADYYLPTIGEVLRFIGVSLAFFLILMAWGPKPRPFSSIKKSVATAIIFEGMYFLSLLLISILYLVRGTYIVLGISYMLQVLLVSPVLLFLSLKIWRYDENTKINLSKWVGLSAVGYLTGIWVNNVFRWFSMTASTDISFLLTGINAFGFFSTIITLSLAVFSAAAGYYFLSKKGNDELSAKLFAVALILVGVNFVNFLLVTAVTNAWRFVLLTEIWPITFLGLGVSMLKRSGASFHVQ